MYSEGLRGFGHCRVWVDRNRRGDHRCVVASKTAPQAEATAPDTSIFHGTASDDYHKGARSRERDRHGTL